MTVAVQILGAVAFLAGLTLLNIDAALIVGGAGLVAAPELLTRTGRGPKGPAPA